MSENKNEIIRDANNHKGKLAKLKIKRGSKSVNK